VEHKTVTRHLSGGELGDLQMISLKSKDPRWGECRLGGVQPARSCLVAFAVSRAESSGAGNDVYHARATREPHSLAEKCVPRCGNNNAIQGPGPVRNKLGL
jgi:hypothetical protein